eukprot:2984-Heterococcus_DN1.PRE.6
MKARAHLRVTDDDASCTGSSYCYIDTPYVLLVCARQYVTYTQAAAYKVELTLSRPAKCLPHCMRCECQYAYWAVQNVATLSAVAAAVKHQSSFASTCTSKA